MTLLWRSVRLVLRVLRIPGVPRAATAAALGGLAAAHVAWANGSAFPFAERSELAEATMGGDEVPGPVPCYAVAGALAVAAALVGGAPIGSPRLRRIGIGVVTGVLALRGVLGLSGHTKMITPGLGAKERFRRLDRTYYGPIALALAAGAGTALLPRRRR